MFQLGEKGGERLGDEDLNIDSAFAIAAGTYIECRKSGYPLIHLLLGSDTTGGTLTILLFYLLRDRAVYKKLRDELDAHFHSIDEIDDPKGLQELPYLNGVVWEGLRLGTPFGGLPRVVGEGGSMIDGEFVPEDIIVVGSSRYFRHFASENVCSLFRLIPSKPARRTSIPCPWNSYQKGGSLRVLARRQSPRKTRCCVSPMVRCIFTFEGMTPSDVSSTGAFSCLGKIFATQELHLTVAKLVLAYDMELPKSFDQQKFLDGVLNMRTTLFDYPLAITATARD